MKGKVIDYVETIVNAISKRRCLLSSRINTGRVKLKFGYTFDFDA